MEGFSKDLCDKFNTERSEDVIESFNGLWQIGFMDEFLKKFKIMKAQMLITNPGLYKSHFLFIFIGVLKDETKMNMCYLSQKL